MPILVSHETRFWNASGISVKADLSGFKVRTESLEALMVGGIAFDNIDITQSGISQAPKTEFVLYKDFDSAEAGIAIILNLLSVRG